MVVSPSALTQDAEHHVSPVHALPWPGSAEPVTVSLHTAAHFILPASSGRGTLNTGFTQNAHVLFLIKPDLLPFDADDRNWSWFKSPSQRAPTTTGHDNSGSGERDSGSNKSTVLSYDIGDKRVVSPPSKPC